MDKFEVSTMAACLWVVSNGSGLPLAGHTAEDVGSQRLRLTQRSRCVHLCTLCFVAELRHPAACVEPSQHKHNG